jgi:hypothetical protein
MVFKIVAGVVARVIAEGDEVYQHHSSARSSLEEYALISMHVDRFFLRVEQKNPASPWRASLEYVLTAMRVDHFFLRVEPKTLPLHGRRRCSPPTWPLRACTASSPRSTKNRPLPWSAECREQP